MSQLTRPGVLRLSDSLRVSLSGENHHAKVHHVWPRVANMSEAHGDPLIGMVLRARYEVIAPLGAGGMSRIYRAIQRPLDRPVALKVLNLNVSGEGDPNSEERFFLEALMTARLRHANTVTIYDYGRSEEGICFMALELLEGQTLREILAKVGPIGWARALRIGAQVAGSLCEAHHLGLVHRDLKPANIMVLEEGPVGDRVKVLDFGLVKYVASVAAQASQDPPESLTATGIVLGSPLYMAPEQARGIADLRSDVYALGAVLFTAIAGRPPFLGRRPLDVLVKHMCDKPPELGTLAAVPKAVSSLVMRCLEKAPEDRFQDAEALLGAMRDALFDEGREPAVSPPATQSCAGLAQPRVAEPPPRLGPGPPPSPRDPLSRVGRRSWRKWHAGKD